MRTDVTQAEIEATWKRCSEFAMEYWNDRTNPPRYNATVQRPMPEFNIQTFQEAFELKELYPRITFRINRMRPEFGNGFIVECVDPLMIVAKG